MKGKLISLLSALMLLLSSLGLAGCGSKRVEEDGAVTEGNYIYSSEERGETEITISFVEKGYGRKWLEEIGKQFVRENPDCTLYLDGDPSLSTSVATKLESGRNLSDIYMPLAIAWQDFAIRGWLEPLDGLYAMKPDGEDGKTVGEKLTGDYRTYGKVTAGTIDNFFALPWNQYITGIAYNAGMFEEYGWTVPETLDQLIALCERILADTNGTVAPFVYPGATDGYFDFLVSTWWAQSAGVSGYNEFFRFESPETWNPGVQPALGRLHALNAFTKVFGKNVNKYSLEQSMSKNNITAQMDFINGHAAMIPNASWLETEIGDSVDADFKMRMMRIPYIPEAQKNGDDYLKVTYGATPDFIMIPAGAKNKDAAKRFLAFMSRDDMLALYTKLTATPRPFDYDVSAVLPELSQFGKSCIEIWQDSESFLDTSKSLLYYKQFAKKYLNGLPFTKIVRGEQSAAQYCNTEYLTALDKWDIWLSDAGIA